MLYETAFTARNLPYFFHKTKHTTLLCAKINDFLRINISTRLAPSGQFISQLQGPKMDIQIDLQIVLVFMLCTVWPSLYYTHSDQVGCQTCSNCTSLKIRCTYHLVSIQVNL